MTFFRRLRSVRLIRLEQRSLLVGKNFGLAKTLIRLDYQVSDLKLSVGDLKLAWLYKEAFFVSELVL